MVNAVHGEVCEKEGAPGIKVKSCMTFKAASRRPSPILIPFNNRVKESVIDLQDCSDLSSSDVFCLDNDVLNSSLSSGNAWSSTTDTLTPKQIFQQWDDFFDSTLEALSSVPLDWNLYSSVEFGNVSTH
mmetsp:Transcript_66920/g.178915  ORF Transcript_66920/g.178915 Transcript_66920/m.178915 type:complete len:129 (-) Transcript_66920:81-467(-)|eukprot:CAMPEP_0113682544 /NCGR_PEP_ID=MMETSP0038_2-20120614/12734_1 /TAXON_ID=2898 /ORGANISM="Cryptomonas paramecium" /LENGTH=128 /DNA_ID=CAMNT_0000601649 /DNA_START=55 /DNA_END=441 /DNA_ORIENTATION=+ /assembly_acc=CAM_ASM_000170